MRPDRLITTRGFLSSIVEQHLRRKDRPFCFILGAGASRASGIATGSELAREWLGQLHEAEDFDQLPLEQWATAENLGIEGFELANLGSFYPEIYSRRFADSPEAGYAFLEDKMQGKDPSFGYSILAYLLSMTQHKVVITTNFDNLVADALSIHSTTFPIVVGHDALASYAQVDLRRPLIAKVHGGLGFAMKSSPEDLQALSATWQKSLHRIFERYSPIIIGYDGNDGSLMSFLEEMKDGIIDGFYWCFHCPTGDITSSSCAVPQRVKDLVEKKHGRLVPIPGFDELMLLIRERFASVLKMPDLLEQMCLRSREREKAYDEQQRALTAKLNTPDTGGDMAAKPIVSEPPSPKADLNQMLMHAAKDLTRERKAKPWWLWENEAAAATSVEDKDRIYQAALAALPQSPELMGNYAIFLKNERRDPKKAEEFYKHAIEVDPKHANNLSNYANYLKNEGKDPEKAEEFYKRAIEAEPRHVNSLGAYAVFLNKERKNPEKAEEFFKRAIEADPMDANNLGNYAIFLQNEVKDPEKAVEFYKRAIEAEPRHANSLGAYATFLLKERKDPKKSEELLKRAIEADPKHESNLANYAIFLHKECKDPEKAEEFYKRAIEADPGHANCLGAYATFLRKERKDPKMVEEFYKRAIEADPMDAINLGNYANYLQNEGKDTEKAEEFYKRAIEADPKNDTNLGNYALFHQRERKNQEKAEEFYKRAIEAAPKNANNLGNYAQVCFLRNNIDEGLKILAQAEAQSSVQLDLQAELLFYRLAHDPQAWPGKLHEMAQLLAGGARSLDWPLEGNVIQAKATGHPNPVLLHAIAGVISRNEPLEGLFKFPEWPGTIEVQAPSTPQP